MVPRIHGMRIRIGPYAGVTDDALRRILQAERWDLDNAFTRWRREREEARVRDAANQPGRSALQQARDWLLASRTRFQNHRRAVDLVYRNLNAEEEPNPQRRLSALRTGGLLRQSQWDVEAAVSLQAHREEDSEEMAEIDRDERRLRLPNPNQVHQDQRLAAFVEIAGTDDWVSLREVLEQHSWDLAAAVDLWITTGVPTKKPAKEETKRKDYQAPEHPHNETENLWPADRPTAGPLLGVDDADAAEARFDYGYGPHANRLGWMVNYDDTAATAGVNGPEKKRLDYIRDGRYTVIQFRNPIKEGTGTRATKDKAAVPAVYEDFDYLNTDHVSQLNRWRSQPPRRMENIRKKAPTQAFHPLELKWLYDWHNEIVQETLRREPNYREEGGKWPVKFDTRKLEKDFNKEFAGRTDLPNTDGVARSERSKNSIDVRRKRIWELCNDLGITFSPAHGKKDKKKEEQKGEKKDEDKKEKEAQENDNEDAQNDENEQSRAGGEGGEDDEEDENDERSDDGGELDEGEVDEEQEAAEVLLSLGKRKSRKG